MWFLVQLTLLVLPFLQQASSRPVEDAGALQQETRAVHFPAAGRVQSLAGTAWNLSLCTPGLQLRLAGKLVNRQEFVVTNQESDRLQQMLYGETLADRVYVWCRTALLIASLTGHQVKVFDVEQINLFQGDIILSRDSVDLILAKYFPTPSLRAQAFDAAHRHQHTSVRSKRKVTAFNQMLWDNALVYYRFTNQGDEHVSLKDRVYIRQAMNHWEEQTCLRFIELNSPRSSQPHLIFITGNSCYSYIGKQSRGQEISIGTGCAYLGTIAHEIGHAIGFSHEQSRPDRDRYVTINLDVLQKQFSADFARTKWRFSKTHGIPYDYSSVMHYKSTDFSLTGKEVVLTASYPEMQKVMGQREGLSFLDAKLANVVYCSRQCRSDTLEWEKCEHDGYRNPSTCTTCICPRGFAPPHCSEPAPGIDADCGQQVLRASEIPKILSSTGYDTTGFPSPATCFWLIKSSPDKRIKFQFTGRFNFTEDLSCQDYVEVRYKVISMTGPRFCAKVSPNKSFVSHGSEVLILAHTLDMTYWQGFQITFQEEKCGGCSQDADDDEPKCTNTTKFMCNGESSSKNYCFKEEQYCCDGFDESGHRCIRTKVGTSTPTNSTTAISETIPFTTTKRRTTNVPTIPSTTLERSTTSVPTISPKFPEIQSTSMVTKPAPTRLSTPILIATTTVDETAKEQLTATSPFQATTSVTATSSSTKPATVPKTSTRPSPTPRRKRILTFIRGHLTTPRPGFWSSWSVWSSCSATCGLCGSQSRNRECLGGKCEKGHNHEQRACGSGLCPVELVDVSRICYKTCDSRGWWSSCFKTKICFEKRTKPRCCVGVPNGGACR